MTAIPTSFDEIDQILAGNAQSEREFRLVLPALAALVRRPCWETSLLQWLATEITDSRIAAETGTSTAAVDVLGNLRNTLCGASLCLLPADLFHTPAPSDLVRLRDLLVEQQETWPDLASLGNAFVICADHLVANSTSLSSNRRGVFRLPARLYPPSAKGAPTDWDGFNSLVRDLVRAVCGQSLQPMWSEPSQETAIPTILHELFKNTHEHARTWWDGTKPKFSLRGVAANFFDLESFDNLAKGPVVLDPASAYVREVLELRKGRTLDSIRSKNVRGFLELSIFDTGPGLVGRMMGSDPTLMGSNEQLEVVKDCLKRGYSSTDNETRGYGLSKVLSRLKKSHGFIRIRTNGVNAYRSFARFNALEAGSDSGYDRLLDWKIMYSPRQSTYRSLRGTVITVMIPMGKTDEEASNP